MKLSDCPPDVVRFLSHATNAKILYALTYQSKALFNIMSQDYHLRQSIQRLLIHRSIASVYTANIDDFYMTPNMKHHSRHMQYEPSRIERIFHWHQGKARGPDECWYPSGQPRWCHFWDANGYCVRKWD